MRILTVALGTALVLCNLGTFSDAAHAQKAKVVREPRERVIVRVPVVTPTPWDYYIVPRYRYRPQDDRIDLYGPRSAGGAHLWGVDILVNNHAEVDCILRRCGDRRLTDADLNRNAEIQPRILMLCCG